MSPDQYEKLVLERPDLQLLHHEALCCDARELIRKHGKKWLIAEASAWILSGEKLWEHALWDIPF